MPRNPAFISHSREREAQIQRRLLDVLTARFNRKIRGEIAAWSEHLANVYAESGMMPPNDDDHVQALRAVYLDMAEQSIRTFGRRMTVQGKALGYPVEAKGFFADLFHSLALTYINLESVRRRIVSVAETTRAHMIRAVDQGQREGLGVDAIASLMRERIPTMSRYRGALIARTETHGAANFGAHETAKATGLDLLKEWVAVEDHRTRDFGQGDGVVDEFDHRAMNKQTVEMDEPFKMPWRKGGEVLCQFPGDPSLPPGAVINCRCAVVHTVRGLDD